MIGLAPRAGGSAAPWKLPDRLLPYLEPAWAVHELSRRLPRLEIREFLPDRVDPRADAVTLQGTLRCRDADGEASRLVSIRVAPGAGETVRVSPDDPALPHLPEIVDPSFATRLVRVVTGRPVPTPGVRILSHRFGRRACFRMSHPAGTLLGRAYAVRGDASLVTTLGALAGHRAPLGAAVPRVMFHDRRRRLVVLTWLPGSPWHGSLEDASVSVAAQVGIAVRRYRGVPAGALPPWGLEDEVRTIVKLAARAAAVRPALAPELEAAIRDVSHADSRPEGAPVFAHRDLHDKQIVVGDAGPGIIDWDCAAAAPAALDPGNFVAHLRLRELQGRLPADRAPAVRRAFLEGCLEDEASSADLARWEALALLRLAAVYALRPRWDGVAEALLSSVRGRPR